MTKSLMMSNRYSSIRAHSIFFLLFLLFSTPFIQAQQTIRIGVLSFDNTPNNFSIWKPTEAYLNEELPEYNFTFKAVAVDQIEQEVANQKIDLVICNPKYYILLRENYGVSAIATLQKFIDGKPCNKIGGLIFTLQKNKDINIPADIKGKTVAAIDCISYGGLLLPRTLLKNQGLDLFTDPKTLVLTYSHEDAVRAVLNGKANIGIVKSGVIEKLASQGEVNIEDFKTIQSRHHTDFPFLTSTGLIPESPLCKLAHLPDSIAKMITQKLFEIGSSTLIGSNLGWSLPADYSFVEEKIKLLNEAPFETKESFLNKRLSHDWRLLLLLIGITIGFALFLIFSRYLSNFINKDKNSTKDNIQANEYSSFYSDKNNFETQVAQKKYILKSYTSKGYLKWLAIITIVYYLSVEFGLLFSFNQGSVTAIWYATGIAFLAIYILGYRIWPAIFIGAILVYISSIDVYTLNLHSYMQIDHIVLNAANNVFESVLAVYIVRRYSKTQALFNTIQSSIQFIILPGLLVSLIAASIGSLSYVLVTAEWSAFYDMLLTWWLSDMAGLLFVVPLVLSWKKLDFGVSRRRTNILLLIFTIILAIIAVFVLSVGYHVAYIFLPFFIYFTFRFGKYLSFIMAFILSLISAGAIIYLNITWLWTSPEEGLFYVRLFLIILIFSILMVSAILAEQKRAEERMRLYKMVFENSTEGIAIIDPNGYYIEQNMAHLNLIGYSDKELFNQTPALHFGEKAFRIIGQELTSKGLSFGEWKSNTKFGEKPLELSAFSVFNNENQLVCHVGIQRDISDRKKAENNLKKSKAEAWGLFEHAAIPIMIEDFSSIKKYLDKLTIAGLSDWEAYFDQNPKEIEKLASLIRVIDVNEKMVDFYGEGSREKLFKNLIAFFTEESKEVFKNEIIALAKGNFTFSSEIQIRNLNGELIYLLLNLSIPPLYRDTFERVMVSFDDISKIVKADKIQKTLVNISMNVNKAEDLEEAVNAVREGLSSIMDTTNFFLALYDDEKDEITLPFLYDEFDIAARIPAGKTITSLVIRNQRSLLLNHHELSKMEAQGIIEPVGTSSKIWLGVPIIIKEKVIGAFVVQSYTNENAYNEIDKETLELVANQIAISIERKKAEESILSALEKAQESDQLKSSFLASMSHELRTPLNAIIGFSNLIDNEMTIEQATEFALIIHKSGSNLLKIVDSIFEVSLLDEGEQKINFSHQKIDDLLKDILQTILTRQKVLNKTLISLSIKEHELNQQNIYTDQTKLQQIFLHLLNNALKFTHEGEISFGLQAFDDKKGYAFFVKDTGIGINKEKQAIIFDRFRMVDDTHNRQYEGMGIGLYLCKKLIELLGGKIQVESNPEEGSVFTFYIPLQKKKQIF